jgi:hypothetical protein
MTTTPVPIGAGRVEARAMPAATTVAASAPTAARTSRARRRRGRWVGSGSTEAAVAWSVTSRTDRMRWPGWDWSHTWIARSGDSSTT